MRLHTLFTRHTYFTPHLAIALAALFTGCASDGTSPDPAGRNLGILQMMVEGGGAAAQGSGGASTGSAGGVSWDLPPGEGVLFPPEVLQTPLAAVAGFPFGVTVFTVGPNGCWSPDGMEVSVSPGIVDLLPWDLHSGAEACTMIFGYLAHDTTLVLPQAGDWTLRVQGRRIRGDGSVDGSVRGERQIQVYPPSNVPVPSEVQLSPGDEIVAEGVLRLRFVGVEGDSRCPRDVQCVWQGNAGVRLALETVGGAPETVLLNTGIAPSEVVLGGYRIRLLSLTPEPLSTATILPGAFTATLRLDPHPTP